MKLRIFISFFLFSFAVANAASLCEKILIDLHGKYDLSRAAPRRSKDLDSEKVDALIGAILGFDSQAAAHAVRSASPTDPDYYGKMMKTQEPGEKAVTGHQELSRGFDESLGEPYANYVSDTSMVITIPPAGKAVWKGLTIAERALLIDRLEGILKNAPYDSRKGVVTNYMHEIADAKGGQLGFVPARVLAIAAKGCPTGECRMSNSVLAALLVELGMPESDIRLMASDNHAWLEVRAEKGSAWRIVDATGTSPRKAADPLSTPFQSSSVPRPAVQSAQVDRNRYPKNAEWNLFGLRGIQQEKLETSVAVDRDKAGKFTTLTAPWYEVPVALETLKKEGIIIGEIRLRVGVSSDPSVDLEKAMTHLAGVKEVALLSPVAEEANSPAATAQILSLLPTGLRSVGFDFGLNDERYSHFRRSPAFAEVRELRVSPDPDSWVISQELFKSPPPRLERISFDYQIAWDSPERKQITKVFAPQVRGLELKIGKEDLTSFDPKLFPQLKMLKVEVDSANTLQSLVQKGLLNCLDELEVTVRGVLDSFELLYLDILSERKNSPLRRIRIPSDREMGNALTKKLEANRPRR